MTTPDPSQFSREYVLSPIWDSNIANIFADFQDPESNAKTYRAHIPVGIWSVSVSNESRFSATVVLMRNSQVTDILTVPTMGDEGHVQIQTEVPAHIYIRLSGTANTNDQNTSRIGIIATRLGGFEF